MDVFQDYLKELGSEPLYSPVPNFSPFMVGSGFNTVKYFGPWYTNIQGTPLLLVADRHVRFGWMVEKKFVNTSKEMLEKSLRDLSEANQRRARFDTLHANIDDEYTQQTYSVLRTQSVPELQARIHRLFDTIWDANAMAFFSFFLDKQLCQSVLKEQGSTISLNELWEQGTQSTTPSFETVDHLALSRKYIEGLSPEELAEYAQYTTCSYTSVQDLTVARAAVQPLLDLSLEEIKQDIEKQEAEWRTKRATFEAWRDSRTPEEARLLDYLQTIIYLRDARKHIIRKGLTTIWRIGEILSDSIGLDHDLLPYITREEITGDLQALSAQKEDIARRPDGFIQYISGAGKSFQACVQNLAELQQSLEQRHFGTRKAENKTIQGQSASPGQATGKARIILHTHEFASFQPGDILVTSMTRPEFVPLMKKARAVVTDEGGITCHAAIVSRELGIPCVIGTKIATRHISDGSTILVDGSAGVVTLT